MYPRIGLVTYAIFSYVCVGVLISYALISNATLFGAIRYLSFEKISVVAYGNATIATLALIIQLLLKLTLGRLRELEIEQLIEHGKSTVLDTILFLILAAPTVNGGDVPHSILITCLSGIICSKLFHSLAQIRVSHLSEAGLVDSQSLGRLAVLLSMLIAVDALAVKICYSRASFSSSFYLWILFEALGLLVTSSTGLSKIAVLFVDMSLEAWSESSDGWKLKNEYMFCLDLSQDVGTLAIYLIFLLLFVFANPTRLPIYLASDIIQVTRTLIGKITSFRRYRKLAARLEIDFPEATLEELEEADTCIICRDLLTIGSKKLICGHILHFECLKGWFVHHQSCPTCRTEIPTQPQIVVKPTTSSGTESSAAINPEDYAPFEYPNETVVGTSYVLSGTSTHGMTSNKAHDRGGYQEAQKANNWHAFFLGPCNKKSDEKDQEIARLLRMIDQIDEDQNDLTMALKRAQLRQQ